MKASVEKTACIACGLCIDLCPDVFEMDDDGTATAKPGPVPAGAESACREAAEQCPGESIAIDEGN